MSKKLLTIGMAHYADYDGVYFTIQSLRLNNPHLMSQVEFVIVDNSPTLPDAGPIKDLIAHTNAAGTPAKYVSYASPGGTSPSRNEIFKQASGKYVLAMDCHVLLWPGALEGLLNYYEQNPDCNDLIQGPMFYDNLQAFTTHFNPVWRSEMWGVWSTAWQCKCGKFKFSFGEDRDGALPCTLDMKMTPVQNCPNCEKLIPRLAWGGHERAYEALGFQRVIHDSDGPFPIPGQGLGLFSCRKDAWLGFHPLARGFGAEELCIHEAYRQAGHQAICLPQLKWLHRFGRPNGVKYPIPRWHKVRNYVLWYRQLGLDLTPIREHFVAGGLVGQAAWDALTQNPDAMEQEPSNSGCATCGGAAQALPEYSSMEQLYAEIERRPRDLNEHMATFKKYAALCKTVTEMTARRESTIALLAGRPEQVTSYSTEVDGYVAKSVELVKDTTKWQRNNFTMGTLVNDLQECDLLFIDTKHNYAHLKMELAAYQTRVKRFIILHDTVVYGVTGDDNGPGLMQAMAEFMRENPQWKVIRQHNNQYGLTILGCQEQDYPQGPGTELHNMLAELGINPSPTCECNERMTAMNDWRVAGCKENRETIIGWLRDGQVKWGWRDRMVAMAKAVASGIAFKLNPLDPMPGMVDEAIRRAELKEAAILPPSNVSQVPIPDHEEDPEDDIEVDEEQNLVNEESEAGGAD